MVYRVSHEWKISEADVYALDYSEFSHRAAYLSRKQQTVEKTDYYLCRLMAVIASIWGKKSYSPKDFLLGETPGDVMDAQHCDPEALRMALLSTLGPGLTQEQIDALPDEVKDRTNG